MGMYYLFTYPYFNLTWARLVIKTYRTRTIQNTDWKLTEEKYYGLYSYLITPQCCGSGSAPGSYLKKRRKPLKKC
jgi:hypothetical protein